MSFELRGRNQTAIRRHPASRKGWAPAVMRLALGAGDAYCNREKPGFLAFLCYQFAIAIMHLGVLARGFV
ncbi:MAG TPA: hypothetical protein VI168_09795 [Croceibacterium sp.]